MLRLGRIAAAKTEDEAGADVEINMMPLIDMIFILLIFFLVTASFVRESGVEVNRPEAATAQQKEAAGMLVGITQAGQIYIDGQEVDLRRVRGMAEIFLAENPQGGIILDADAACPTGRLVAVLDQCRMAGAENIAVAARRIE